VESTKPITGIAGCCPPAASGHAAAALPSSVMNWRRLTLSMGSPPEPAVPAYRRLRMPRKHPQVLGAVLNRSESKRRAACPSMVPAQAPDFTYSRQASAEHFEQCAEFALLPNPRLGALAVTALPIPLAPVHSITSSTRSHSGRPPNMNTTPAQLETPRPTPPRYLV
jgi:hypothetical protein